jgi:putative ABC transport system permease protein
MIIGIIARLRSIWRAVRSRSVLESEMTEEFRLHVDLRAQDLERRGMPPREALRRARQEFGSPARYKEEARESRGVHRIDQIRFSLLDFKLGFRMLARYPGLTLVGCFAIAVAIGLGALYFEGINKVLKPTLPLRDADRLVGIRNLDVRSSTTETRSLYDFQIWRNQIRTIDELGVAVAFQRNLETQDQIAEPVRGAEITAVGFNTARVAPMLGRPLLADDENANAPLVVVIDHVLWQTRFNGNPGVLGQAITVGGRNATIVGVMPEGFRFPINQSLWLPLRLAGQTFEPRSGPAIQIFGRLAPGATLEQAQAELAAIGQRTAADLPETHKNLRPSVKPYGESVTQNLATMVSTVLYTINIAFVFLLIVVCANVATLVFARTATRGWEITVRNALGASRGRIISQLFVEALVLAGVSAVLGIALAKIGLKSILQVLSSEQAGLPFWVNSDLSPLTLLYAALLTLLGAAVVGVLPALRITRQPVQDALRREAAAKSGLRFGGFWTGVIVAQVAITVAFLPLAVAGAMEASRWQRRIEGLAAERYLSAVLRLDDNSIVGDSARAAWSARQRTTLLELERRLAAEPGVERLTYANRLPGQDQFKYNIEVDTVLSPNAPGLTRRVTANIVGAEFFATFGTSIARGRAFTANESNAVIIVNESFVQHVLAGRNPLGQRIRYPGVEPVAGGDPDDDTRNPNARWYEIVGVVRDFGYVPESPVEASAIYHPLSENTPSQIHLAILARGGDAASVAPRLRAIANEVNPDLRLYDVVPLSEIGGGEAAMNWLLTSVGGLVGFIVLLLSATGIHSLMSFTVARRTREIGIRAALGAQPRLIVGAIFARATLQLSIGVVAGCVIAAMLGLNSGSQLFLLGLAVAVMMVVGLIACAVPLRRALSIHPTDALRVEG